MHDSIEEGKSLLGLEPLIIDDLDPYNINFQVKELTDETIALKAKIKQLTDQNILLQKGKIRMPVSNETQTD